ncbi:MAG TPA: RNA polymerase-associated protein RapA [Rhodanobacteraceae bacterium]|nr:RNA polymerase-associated protein RapA [Rhodanobacteraceae bacterium]
MPAFVPGQRWISTAEPELGLGTVLRVEGRAVEVLFAKAGVLRRYAQQSAPLVRANFRVGQQVSGNGTKLSIERIEEEDGLLQYFGGGKQLGEGALDDEQSISQADERLLTGRVDLPDQFDLRREAWQRRAAARRSPAFGLNGARIELLPHQLRVAQAATSRLPPRVLLADEVGLGKTIEAGMIIARQLASGRARRVLVLVPDSLVNQWFVELLRRFNLAFAIFDESRTEAIEAAGDGRNPFEDEQCVIVSVGFLAEQPRRAEQALAAGWDLLVVDEAHHLEWTPAQASDEYALVEQLAAATPGVVLLTATPEQLGRSGHFARLRLLDRARYRDLDAYIAEAQGYVELSQLADRLQAGDRLSAAQVAGLRQRYAGDPALLALLVGYADGGDAETLLDALVDRHGTGRVMFRNRRARVGGFPERRLDLSVIDAGGVGEARRQALLAEFRGDVQQPPAAVEAEYDDDPRLPWLLDLLERHPQDKFLLICRSQQKVLELERVLKPTGIKLARFHEGLGLLQRDRNAAWFAQDDGARLLLASEIGSEGRNFQFAHRLVLWDLPLDPDLLEQRIGRLDRIGQAHAVEIHLAVVRGSAQHLLARWLDEGIDAFRHSPADGRALLRRFAEPLLRLCTEDARGVDELDQEFETLLAETRAEHEQLSARIHEGRDRLLELAALRDSGGEVLRAALLAADNDNARDEFALRLLERFGVQVDDLGGGVFRLDPETLSTDALGGFEAGAQSITFDRTVALARDDLRLLRLDHPLLQGALDLLLSTETGNAALLVDAALPPRQGVLQAVFVLECVAEAGLDVERFLPPTPLRVNIDTVRRERREFEPSAEALQRAVEQPLDADRYRRFLVRLVPPMLAAAEAAAQRHAARCIDEALALAQQQLCGEIERLRALLAINHSVRATDIEALEAERAALAEALPGARVRLDALRLVVSADVVG